MPKKKVVIEEPEEEPLADYSEPEPEPEPEPIKISKRTGKPTRPLTEKQLETLKKGRELAIQKRKELSQSVEFQKKAEAMKVAKEELKKTRDMKQKERFESSKKKYEDEMVEYEKELNVEEPKANSSGKKVKKKVIKYVEASSSSESEEEEVIIRKKKKDKPKHTTEPSVEEKITRENLRSKLHDVESASLAKMLMPSYF